MTDIIEQWDVCDDHEQSFPRHGYCPYCRIEELEEGVAEWHLKAYRQGKRIYKLGELQRKYDALVDLIESVKNDARSLCTHAANIGNGDISERSIRAYVVDPLNSALLEDDESE